MKCPETGTIPSITINGNKHEFPVPLQVNVGDVITVQIQKKKVTADEKLRDVFEGIFGKGFGK